VVPNLWTPIASVPLDSDACGLSVTWEPPNPPPLGEVMFRAVATDLQGRTFVAYAPGTVGVLAGSGAGDSPAPPPFTDPACGGVGETSPALPECNAAGGSGSSSGPATGGSTSGSGTAADSGTSEPTTSAGTNGDTGSGAASTITATTTSSASSVGDGEAESVASASCACRSQPGDLPVATLLAGLLLARRRRH
jgi:MYXO-CTERM domain-containing protein